VLLYHFRVDDELQLSDREKLDDGNEISPCVRKLKAVEYSYLGWLYIMRKGFKIVAIDVENCVESIAEESRRQK